MKGRFRDHLEPKKRLIRDEIRSLKECLGKKMRKKNQFLGFWCLEDRSLFVSCYRGFIPYAERIDPSNLAVRKNWSPLSWSLQIQFSLTKIDLDAWRIDPPFHKDKIFTKKSLVSYSLPTFRGFKHFMRIWLLFRLKFS